MARYPPHQPAVDNFNEFPEFAWISGLVRAEVALVACDTAVGASMESLYLDDLRFAEEITLEIFRRRSRAQRLLERAASVMASVL